VSSRQDFSHREQSNGIDLVHTRHRRLKQELELDREGICRRSEGEPIPTMPDAQRLAVLGIHSGLKDLIGIVGLDADKAGAPGGKESGKREVVFGASVDSESGGDDARRDALLRVLRRRSEVYLEGVGAREARRGQGPSGSGVGHLYGPRGDAGRMEVAVGNEVVIGAAGRDGESCHEEGLATLEDRGRHGCVSWNQNYPDW
jgi:hypothetical protein